MHIHPQTHKLLERGIDRNSISTHMNTHTHCKSVGLNVVLAKSSPVSRERQAPHVCIFKFVHTIVYVYCSISMYLCVCVCACMSIPAVSLSINLKWTESNQCSQQDSDLFLPFFRFISFKFLSSSSFVSS